jgi:LmbE family N-acetylglucosaminyl deacetylase
VTAPVDADINTVMGLVVAPHPDDEPLGADGLMQQVLESGGPS